MSRYAKPALEKIAPYVPGEQPQDRSYVKLNTNESPFPPSPKAQAYAANALERLQLYPDPECTLLVRSMADSLGLEPENVLLSNGSDEILFQAFSAFCDKDRPAVFPDISYGFYSVYAEFLGIPYREIPLMEDFSIRPEDYYGAGGTIFIANPNAPTALALDPDAVESIVMNNPDSVVVIDEAYMDFCGTSAVPLTKKYDNLLVVQTFSKSRSMAGARLGMGFADAGLIGDLKKAKYSMNPYNVNSATLAAGLGAWEDTEYTRMIVETVKANREYTAGALKELGFRMTESRTNFLFVSHPALSGGDLYRRLKGKGILVRHFDKPRIDDYVRVTVGSREEMDSLLEAVRGILEET